MAGVRTKNRDKEHKAKVELLSLATLHSDLAANAKTIFKWSRGRVPQQLLSMVCSDESYSAVARVEVEACLIGLWLIQDFWFSGERDIAWGNSLEKRRRRTAPYQKELRAVDLSISKLIPANDRWLTSAGRDRMQVLLIIGLMSELTDKRIEIGYLRPLYPIIVPFIQADNYAEVMSAQLASDEWEDFAGRVSTDDDIYQRIRVRFYELKKSAQGSATAFALGRKLLNQVKAIIQTL